MFDETGFLRELESRDNSQTAGQFSGNIAVKAEIRFADLRLQVPLNPYNQYLSFKLNPGKVSRKRIKKYCVQP
jgi:hypothetical protein